MSKTQLISKIDGLIVRESGPWVKKKHYYLSEYAKIFTAGMGKKWASLTYIDLFAGPGRCIIKDSSQELDGSPFIALQHNFDQYIFVEENTKLLEALKVRCQSSPKHAQIEFINGDCNVILAKVLAKIHQNSLCFAFVDPTDIEVNFETIEKFAQRKYGVDLLVNIQDGMDIKRNFRSYKKEGDVSRLGRFLGKGTSWDKIKGPKDAVEYYKKRIADLGYKTVRYKDIPIKNTKNAPMYFLLFASKHPRGLDFWEKITKRDEQGQGELF